MDEARGFTQVPKKVAFLTAPMLMNKIIHKDKYVQGSAIEWSLGCMIPASWWEHVIRNLGTIL